jgi:electron-transferring-flavoprotein dehydrogenase
MWLNTIIPGVGFGYTLKHGKPTHSCDLEAQGTQVQADRVSQARWRLTFDRLTSVSFSATNHEEDQPVHLKLADPSIPVMVNLPDYAEPAQRYCPAGVYEIVTDERAAAVPDQRAELRPLQNLRHQGPQPEHHWTCPGRRRGSELRRDVSGELPHIRCRAAFTLQGAGGGGPNYAGM